MDESSTRTAGHFHAVKFYDTTDAMSRVVAKFIGEGLVEQQPALILAMPDDHASILTALRDGYIDVDRARRAGDVVLIDASDFLARVMVGDMPDPHLFTAEASAVLKQILRGRTESSIRAYGGMVSYLWATGQAAAALAVERLWNVLALTHRFSLLCGYSFGPYDQPIDPARICEQHSHVMAPRAPLWLTDSAHCPVCGTPLPPGPRADVVYRCQGCVAELIDFADAHDFVMHHLQARAPTRRPGDA